jgi:hypothetical protein
MGEILIAIVGIYVPLLCPFPIFGFLLPKSLGTFRRFAWLTSSFVRRWVLPLALSFFFLFIGIAIVVLYMRSGPPTDPISGMSGPHPFEKEFETGLSVLHVTNIILFLIWVVRASRQTAARTRRRINRLKSILVDVNNSPNK